MDKYIIVYGVIVDKLDNLIFLAKSNNGWRIEEESLVNVIEEISNTAYDNIEDAYSNIFNYFFDNDREAKLVSDEYNRALYVENDLDLRTRVLPIEIHFRDSIQVSLKY